MIDKTINDVTLKKLTFQTGQTKWDGGSILKHVWKYVWVKMCVEIRKGEKVCGNTCNVI